MAGRSFTFTTLIVVLLFIPACSQPGPASTQVPDEIFVPAITAQAEVTAELAVTASTSNEFAAESAAFASDDNATVFVKSSCVNPYYPVREGSTWNYQLTGSMLPSYTFTDTITAIHNGGFTLTSEFDGSSHTQEWVCTPEGLVALQMGGGVSTKGINLKAETQNASGVMYPVEINPGDTWQYTLDFTGTMEMASGSGDAIGSIRSDYTALGTDSVTVPAGTFNALKVQVVTTFDANVNFQGIVAPVKFTTTSMSWYAEGTGWVKTESSGDFSGQSSLETIELQWYNLP